MVRPAAVLASLATMRYLCRVIWRAPAARNRRNRHARTRRACWNAGSCPDRQAVAGIKTVMFTYPCKHLKFFHVFKGLRCFFQFRCKQKGVFRSVVYSSCEAHLSLLQRGGLCCLSIAWRSDKNTFTSAPSASHHSMSSTASSLRSPTSQRLTYC